MVVDDRETTNVTFVEAPIVFLQQNFQEGRKRPEFAFIAVTAKHAEDAQSLMALIWGLHAAISSNFNRPTGSHTL